MKLYVATHNEHKLCEISQILPKFEIVADDPAGGYLLGYQMPRKWNDNMYLYPVPENVILKNDNLKQNPGWK